VAPAPRAQQRRPEEVAIALAVAKVRREPTSPNSAFELTGIRLVKWCLAALLASPKAAVVSGDDARASCSGPQLNASRWANGEEEVSGLAERSA
jgi:hypothetical protein